MRAALPVAAPSPAVPLPAAPGKPGARPELGTAFLLALVPLALYARVLFYPRLEVSDASSDLAAFPWRLASLLLHAAGTMLVFGIARRVGAATAASVLAALFFAVNPTRVEAVAWLAQGRVLLGGVLFLPAVFLSPSGEPASPRPDRGPPRSRAVLLLSLLAEPRLALGPLWLHAFEHRLLGRSPTRSRLALDVLLALLAVAWLLTSSPAGLDPDAPGLATRLVQLPIALFGLVRLACWPGGLSPYHPSPSVAPGLLAAGWLALALLLMALVRLSTHRPRFGLAGLLFLLLAAPHALFPRGDEPFTESAGPVSLAGFELLLASGLAQAASPARLPKVAAGLLLVLAWAARSSLRLSAWRSEPELQEAALSVRDEPSAHDALGQWHRLHGRLGAAQREHERALALARSERGGRGSALPLLHLGELELRRALIPGQEEHLRRAAPLLEECLAAHLGWPRANEVLGEVCQRAGEDERARACLEDASADSPSAHVYVLLGRVRGKLLDAPGSRAAFQLATELDPGSAEAWSWLGLVQLQAEELDASTESLRRALDIEPELADARVTLARIQLARGERAEAEHDLRRALGVNPDSVDGLYELGMLLSAAGRAGEALRYLDHLCEQPRRPPHVRAHLESARLRMARGEVEVPRRRLRAVLEFNPEQAEALALLARLPADGTDR